MDELSQVVLLFYLHGLCQLAQLLVIKVVCDQLRIAMEVRDRRLGQCVRWQYGALVAAGRRDRPRGADFGTVEIKVYQHRLPALLDCVVNQDFAQSCLAALL